MKKCPKCGFENPDIAKFCNECGIKLGETKCPKCGFENTSIAKFCNECGTALNVKARRKSDKLKKRADGRYCKQIRINGKVKSFYGKSQAEINKKILAYRENESNGDYFKNIAAEWEREYLKNVPYTTYKKCGQSAYTLIINTFGGNRIKQISAHDIDNFLKKIAAKDYAQKTVATYKSILNQIFKYSVINGYVISNPVSTVSLPKNLKKSIRELPSSEDIKVVSTLHEGFGFLAYFLLYTGLRISEALALEYSDIDRDNKLITVNKKIVHDGNTPLLKHETKTEAGTRQVILMDRVAKYLPCEKTGIIFCNENGDYLTKKQLQCRWNKMKKDNGVTLTAHQLRHAYATMLFEAGVSEKDAQELMGHSDIHLTQSIYTHIRKERKQQTAEKLNAFNF